MAAGLLIAFDGSAAAEAAVRAAGTLFPGARATVLTIHEPAVGAVTAFRAGGGLMAPDLVEQHIAELEQELVAEAETAAAEGAKLADATGLAAEPAIARGARQPWEPILATAAERGADVVVCGSRGRGAVARSVLGSTSSSLLHHAQRTMLIVPEAEATPDGPALIAYDGSSPAAHEAIAATGRLLPGRAALVVHAWDSPFRQSVAGRALRGVPLPEIREVTNDVETWVREEAEATVAEGVELARAHRARGGRRRGRGLLRLAGIGRDGGDPRRRGGGRRLAGARGRRLSAPRLGFRRARASRGAADAHRPRAASLIVLLLVVTPWRRSPRGRRDRRGAGGGRQRTGLRRSGVDGQRLVVVPDLQRLSREQLVVGGVLVNLDAEAPAAVEQAEAEAGELGRQARGEGERVAVIPHAAEARDRDEPGAGQ
jgi:nucleotide-binding universal stress UspA family protein